jgi:hypothetical protein
MAATVQAVIAGKHDPLKQGVSRGVDPLYFVKPLRRGPEPAAGADLVGGLSCAGGCRQRVRSLRCAARPTLGPCPTAMV